jgi:hypothetical protein
VSDEALSITRLQEEDLAQMFAASAVLLSYLAAHYEEIQA